MWECGREEPNEFKETTNGRVYDSETNICEVIDALKMGTDSADWGIRRYHMAFAAEPVPIFNASPTSLNGHIVLQTVKVCAPCAHFDRTLFRTQRLLSLRPTDVTGYSSSP